MQQGSRGEGPRESVDCFLPRCRKWAAINTASSPWNAILSQSHLLIIQKASGGAPCYEGRCLASIRSKHGDVSGAIIGQPTTVSAQRILAKQNSFSFHINMSKFIKTSFIKAMSQPERT